MAGVGNKGFEEAVRVGRPANVQKLFPNSRALIVSGKAVDRAMLKKGRCMALAANGRSHIVIRGVLAAAKKADAAVIIEIAKSEGGAVAYCATNYWNMARQVDQVLNELGAEIPVAVHADHYGIKNARDVEIARVQIPSMFDAGITSIAIDASHLPEDENLLSSLALAPYVPAWAGLETEVGEIKGKSGLSTREEALFLIQGLNAHNVFPDFIALNNGTTHGLEASETGIQVELTAAIHQALAPYKVNGAQHGTSGNSSEKLRRIARETATTKANVATAFQMISWGLVVNDYGNAELDAEGGFIKDKNEGVTEALWEEMKAYAGERKWKAGDYKSLNLPFENKIMSQPAAIRERMARRVEDFTYNLITQVFYSQDTAPLAVEAILAAQSHDLGPKGSRIEDPAEWTEAKIREKAAPLARKRESGNYDD